MCIRKETFHVSAENVFQAAIDSVEKLNWTIVERNPKSGEIKAWVGASFKSWGEEISIKIFPERTETAIIVTSKITNQLIAWGKNDENEKNFLDELTRGVFKLHLQKENLKAV